ncbi:MAG: molecular chaperone HtpG [Eubacteriales bacterium]|nr:molecular chaperone HtpG [Eubacteriales bacterium]
MSRGKLKINSDKIFPIIKKWLYSDSDIFIREMVSNATDAVTKLKKLEVIGEASFEEGEKLQIDVTVDPEKKTIRFTDNGIGMDANEVEKFINEIAFSGAEAFIEKYQDKTSDDIIIGHFGLGFYSAFMVADRVTIETRSYRPDAEAVFWSCDGSDEFEMRTSEKSERGTVITLYLKDDAYEFCNEYRVREVLQKYCGFMPYPVYLTTEGATPEMEEVETDEKDADGKPIMKQVPKAPVPVNDTEPLWMKTPSACTEEEYKTFYRKVFYDYKEPLFWIHLNMDYPFNLKGILYFPRLSNRYESAEGRIKLYNNQVFIADNIKEVIPEFLLLLRGTLDCPDLPLNVSRSALQNDGFVKKVSDYITKKVADKLTGMCKVDREAYEGYWDDIAPFIKYGCLRDDKFEAKVMPAILFKDIAGKYRTVAELGFTEKKDAAPVEESEEAATEASETKAERTIYYVTDLKEQDRYVKMFKEADLEAVVLPDEIDGAFISLLEAKHEGLHFKRIDASVDEALRDDTATDEKQEADLQTRYDELLKEEAPKIVLQHLKDVRTASLITVSEESRRMADMMKMYGMDAAPELKGKERTLVLNANNALVQRLLTAEGGDMSLLALQLYDLARLQNAPLLPEEMEAFVERTQTLLATAYEVEDETAK